MRSNRPTRLALGLLVAGGLAACDDPKPSSSGDGRGSTTTSTAATSTTAPLRPEALAIDYIRTDARDPKTPPGRFRAEVSADGVSFRMTAADGSQDVARDALTGTATEWTRAGDGAPETAALIRGLSTGGPGHSGLTDGPDLPMSAFVEALGRAGDPRVTTVTRLGRPAWHYDGPYAGDALAGDVVEDHAVHDVDRATGVVLLQVLSARGRETRRFEATAVEVRSADDRSRYKPDPPATADFTLVDEGFRAMTLDELAAAAGYDVLVPRPVPAGFELDEVLFNAGERFQTGAEGLNPAPTRVASMRWRHPDGSAFTVTLLPGDGDPGRRLRNTEWSDPFGAEGTALPATRVELPLEGRAPLTGEIVVAAPALPHVWGLTGDLVVTIDGDLDAERLRAVAGSLRRHTPTAPLSGAPTKCPQIGFTPNSDDVAGEITATGLDCGEAGALVRRTREEHGALGSPRYFRLPPFTCRGVFSDGPGLANTAYRCEDGARRVTWTKT